MMNSAAYDRSKFPQAFWRAFSQVGLPPSMILKQARLPSTLHTDPRGFLNTAQIFAIWQAVEELTGAPDFAFKLLDAFDTSGHQPAFLAASYAQDYRDAILRIRRLKRLGSSEVIQFEESTGEFTLYKDWPSATTPEPALSVDLTFAFLLQLGRKGTGKRITPVRVDFQREGSASEAHETFFGSPIGFGAQRDLIVLRSSDLDRPFPGHNSEFLDMLTPALEAARAELEVTSFAEQVVYVLKRRLASGRPDIASVARDLGTSERTLQRRITDHGTTFRALLVEARQELGEQLLLDPSLGIDEVACLLGYHDTSSFYRAFNEWKGIPPNRWRAQNGRNPVSQLKSAVS
jgi:AraC-like DNA-binding protein